MIYVYKGAEKHPFFLLNTAIINHLNCRLIAMFEKTAIFVTNP